MIDPAGTLHNLATAERTVSSGNKNERLTFESFSKELSSHLVDPDEGAAGNSSLPAQLPSGQKPVNWRQDPDGSGTGTGTGSTSGSTSTTTSQPSGLYGLVTASDPISSTTTPSTTSSSTSSATPSAAQTAADADEAFDNAYWASQPPAVQQLRNIQSMSERTAVATQLANEGYTIDVPIMVWGWDPELTTQLRESLGYTWVPSALQQPIENAPGISSPGLAAYNPNDPPSGSILVPSSTSA